MTLESKYKLHEPEFKTDPFPMLALMRREDPICLVTSKDGERKTWYISRYEDAETVLRDHVHFVNEYRNTRTAEELAQMPPLSKMERLLTQNMHSMDVPAHTRLRALVSKAFAGRMVQQMRPQIQVIADDLLDKVEHNGAMDLIDEYALPLPMLVISELMGVPHADRAQLRVWSRALVDPPQSAEGQRATHKLLQELTAYLGALFAERRRVPQEDLLSALVKAEENGDRLTEDELYSMALLLIFAGFETMVKLIGNSTLLLLQHPEQMALLKLTPALMEGALEELLRCTVPIDKAKIRYAAEDITLSGQLIQRGERVTVLINSANRDESKFTDPETVDITRKHNKHLSFGLGIHYCIGAPLARLEGEIALNTLLRRLPHLRLAVPAATLEWDLASFLYGVKHLPVSWSAQR